MKKLLAATLLCCLAPGVAAAEYGKNVDEMFSKKDTNKDGQISQAEYEQAYTDKFEKADSNNDGQLSKEEYKMLKKDKMDKKDKMGRSETPPNNPMDRSGSQNKASDRS